MLRASRMFNVGLKANRLNCPQCNNDMEEGSATVQGTVIGFLLFGLSHQHLWFRNQDGEKRKIVASNEVVSAFQCCDCGLIVLKDITQIEEEAAKFWKKLAKRSLK